MPLESMDRLFSGELSARKAHKTVMGELKADEEAFRHNVVGSGMGLEKDEPKKGDEVEFA